MAAAKNKKYLWAGMLCAAALAAIQFVPIERGNPPVETDVSAPAEVKSILKRACYDCHSNETVWPWYARVAPMSWLIARDVREGRRELNFSVWNQFSGNRRAKKFSQIAEQMEHGDMPQWYYLFLHPDAKLSAADKEAILNWARAANL
jgi:Haem-binding domain